MPKLRIRGLGDVGIVSDIPAFEVPDNALSDGLNVRPYHGRLTNMPGHEVYTQAPIEPYGLFAVEAPNETMFWVEGGLTKAYVYDGTNHTDITRLAGDFTMDEYTDRWTGGAQGSLAFFNNGADAPQQWDTISKAIRLRDMTYDTTGGDTWQTLNYRCYAMRAYKNAIFALNLNRNGVLFPATVQWSDFVAPGDTQIDWVPRATNLAGEVNLGDSAGNVIDGATLRDDFIIYKEDAAFRCSFTGVDPPFQFTRLPDFVRPINRNCIGIAREFHCIASREDIQIFDGNKFRSILEHKLREFYTTNLWADRLLTTYVVVDDSEKEVWICFPRIGEPGQIKSPDIAIIWNYHDDTLTVNEIPQTRCGDLGFVVPNIGDAFDDPPDITFDEDTAKFDASPFAAAKDEVLMAYGTNVAAFGTQPTDDGTPRECIAERIGIVPPEQEGRFADLVWRIKELRPDINADGPIFIRAGAQLYSNGPVEWEPEQSFDPRNDRCANFRATGRYPAFRIRSQSNINWEMTAIEMDIESVRAR